jgi:FKBP-type peptidyl-prolyl cis-trans isomerase SlyD
MSKSLKIADDQVVSMEYSLTVDGLVVDTSENHEPIEFIQGHGNIIPGLERELYGMTVGESKEVTISPADGYGEVDEEAYVEVPRAQFPADIPLEPGVTLNVEDQSGQPMLARIDKVSEETIRLDFNHPLAGKYLFFKVKIAGLRSATAEELDHGHVHGEGHEH